MKCSSRSCRDAERCCRTRTRHHRTVLIPGDVSMIGKYLMTELTGTTGSTFTGAVVPARAALPMAG